MVKRHRIAAAPPPPRGVVYPHASEAAGWLYVTGQLPTDPAAPQAPFALDIKGQARQALANVAAIVEGAGYSLEETVFVRIYLAEFDRDYDAFNLVYRDFFADDEEAPSRTTVGVARLGRGALVEVDATLYRKLQT